MIAARPQYLHPPIERQIGRCCCYYSRYLLPQTSYLPVPKFPLGTVSCLEGLSLLG